MFDFVENVRIFIAVVIDFSDLVSIFNLNFKTENDFEKFHKDD